MQTAKQKQRYVIVTVRNGKNLPNKVYREKLRELWRYCFKFRFEPHGFGSVFVGPKSEAEMFKTFIEAQGLTCDIHEIS